MTVTSTGMAAAIQGLRQALDAARAPGVAIGSWRWAVRQQLAGLRDGLAAETGGHEESWLAAREGSVLRERNALLARLSALGPRVLQDADVDAVRRDLDRLLVDVAHHRQRLHDLAYDAVELELGGSE